MILRLVDVGYLLYLVFYYAKYIPWFSHYQRVVDGFGPGMVWILHVIIYVVLAILNILLTARGGTRVRQLFLSTLALCSLLLHFYFGEEIFELGYSLLILFTLIKLVYLIKECKEKIDF